MLRIPFEPVFSEMSSILPQAGFRPLREAKELPEGSAILVFNSRNQYLSSIVIVNHYMVGNGLGFISLNNYKDDDDTSSLGTINEKNFNEKYFKKLFEVPVVDFAPQLDDLPKLIHDIGFQPLVEATPDDLPQGSIVLLYNVHSRCITPVITRVLSLSNQRYLHFKQSHIDNVWEPSVIMGHRTPFEDYLYKVIS